MHESFATPFVPGVMVRLVLPICRRWLKLAPLGWPLHYSDFLIYQHQTTCILEMTYVQDNFFCVLSIPLGLIPKLFVLRIYCGSQLGGFIPSEALPMPWLLAFFTRE
jgi:hypothetical protein